MKKTAFITLLLVLATPCFAQVPKAIFHAPTSDVYIGYTGTFPDYGPTLATYRFDGVEIGYDKGLSTHLGLTAAGMISSGPFKGTLMSGTAGLKWLVLTGRFRPFAMGQVGYSRIKATNMYNYDYKYPPNQQLTESGFTYRMGGGVDFQFSQRFFWRAIQWDVQPQSWGRHTPYYQNVGSGIGMKF
jgi:hypothetical protein